MPILAVAVNARTFNGNVGAVPARAVADVRTPINPRNRKPIQITNSRRIDPIDTRPR